MTWLDVPYHEKDAAKTLGGRWDPKERRWYIPSDLDPAPFARWISGSPVLEPGPMVHVQLLGLPEDCWKCGRPTLAVAGILSHGYPIAYEPELGKALAAQPEVAAHLASLGVGPFKRRFSKTTSSAYWSNGCIHCDALLGMFPVWEGFTEALAEGMDPHELVIASVPMPLSVVDALTG